MAEVEGNARRGVGSFERRRSVRMGKFGATWSGTRRRCLLRWIAAATCVLALVPACSSTSSYEVLSFFFDGVPDPSAPAVPPTDGGGAGELPPGDGTSPKLEPSVPATYAHAPFRDNRCQECHRRATGGLVRDPRKGLCRMCHASLLETRRYVHGPAAVDECVYCHHPHSSTRPHLLLADASELCLTCHVQGDLSEGGHHASLDEVACTDCHDPHGGNDPFFLERSDR